MSNDFVKFVSDIDNLFYSKNLHPSDHGKSKIVEVFYDTFRKNAWWYHSTHGDGFDMLSVLSASDYGIDFDMNTNSVTRASKLVPALEKNATWNSMTLSLVRTTMKGVGPGEMFFTFVHPKAVFDSAKDLVIDGKELECKKFTGGCIKGNADSQFRIADNLCKKYDLRDKPRQKAQAYYMNISKLSESYRSQYWKELYPNMSEVNIEKLTNIGATTAKPSQVHGTIVMSEYRKIDNFDSLLLVGEENNPKIIHLTDFEDSDFIQDNIKFLPKFWRGGDTNAVGDGYVVIEGN